MAVKFHLNASTSENDEKNTAFENLLLSEVAQIIVADVMHYQSYLKP